MLPLLVMILTHTYTCHDSHTRTHFLGLLVALTHTCKHTHTHSRHLYITQGRVCVMGNVCHTHRHLSTLFCVCMCPLVLSCSLADHFSLTLFFFLCFSHTNIEQSTKKGPYCRRTPFTPQKVKIPQIQDDNHTLSPSERKNKTTAYFGSPENKNHVQRFTIFVHGFSRLQCTCARMNCCRVMRSGEAIKRMNKIKWINLEKSLRTGPKSVDQKKSYTCAKWYHWRRHHLNL